jgi:hypothetical protein
MSQFELVAPELPAPASSRGPEPEDLVQSVSRALRVLEVVTTSPGLPVKAIARRSGLNLSTTYHLVRTLAYEGYVRRLSDGCSVVHRSPATCSPTWCR